MMRDHEEALDPERIKAELAVAEVKRRARLLQATKPRWPDGWTGWLNLVLGLVFFALAWRVYDRLPSSDLKDLWSSAFNIAFGFWLLSQTQVWMLMKRVDALAELVETLERSASRTK